MNAPALDFDGIHRELARARHVPRRALEGARLRLADIARRFRCSTRLIQDIRDGRQHQRLFAYRAGHNQAADPRMAPGRSPVCACGRLFDFDLDDLGQLVESCPAGCSRINLSRPRRRRRA